MRYTRLIALFGAVLLLASVGLLISHAFIAHTQNASAQLPMSNLIVTPENLKDLGLTFTPVALADQQAQGIIEKEKAIAIALQEMPGLKAAIGNDTSLGLLSNPELQQASRAGIVVDPLLAGPCLVWAVTFHGIDSVSSGPPELPRRYAHDLVVIVDAKIGNYILAFPISDLSQTQWISFVLYEPL
jgi:hypothetical protein